MKTTSLKYFYTALSIISVFGVDTDEVKLVSVNDGGSVTLHTDLNDKQSNPVILWRFKGDRIARMNGEANRNPVYETDERFNDRLKMNPQTGDLTITNIKTELTGCYQLEISIEDTSNVKTFNVTVAGSRDAFSGARDGSCVGVLLVIAVAVVVGVFQCHQIV